jgi:hypothetical protein
MADTQAQPYRILGVLEGGEDAGALYPVLTDKLVPEFEDADGDTTLSYPVRGIYVRHMKDDQITPLNGSGDLAGALWLTDQRLVLVCPNYDKVRWDAGNNLGVMYWGLSVELTDHVASKIYHRVRSRNKAMGAHLYFPWIESVMFANDRGRKKPPTLRFGIVRNLTSGPKKYFLEVHLRSGTDAGALARRILQRIGRWYLDGPIDLNDKGTFIMNELAQIDPLSVPTGTALTSRKIQGAYYVSATTIPEALGAKAAQTRKAAAAQYAAREVARQKAVAFRTASTLGLPPSEVITVPTEGGPRYASPLGVDVDSTKRLWVRGPEELRFHGWGEMRGSVRVDDTGAPDRSSEKVIPLCQGIGQLMVSDGRLAIAVTQGTCAGGALAPKGPEMFIATMPLGEVASIAMEATSDIPGHTGPDLVIRAKDPAWGTITFSSFGAELVNKDGSWVAERKQGDLDDITARLSSLLAHTHSA